jgi:hypothetical protein
LRDGIENNAPDPNEVQKWNDDDVTDKVSNKRGEQNRREEDKPEREELLPHADFP